MEFNFNSFGNSKQTISYCEVDKCKVVIELKQQLNQLKAELHHKTEYIQEQREIINQYSKEIEMYKKCQGKRASKREEELKADNKHLNGLLDQALKELEEHQQALEKVRGRGRLLKSRYGGYPSIVYLYNPTCQ